MNLYTANIAVSELAQKQFFDEPNVFYTGTYGNLVMPKSIWHKGATYITGMENNPERNPMLFRWKNNEVTSVRVAVLDNSDTLDHQHHAVTFINDYAYVFGVNGHGENMRIYKSNTTNIEDGFNLHHEIVGKFGYCIVSKLPDGRIVVTSRLTGATGSINFSQVYFVSGVNDLTTWTETNSTTVDYNTTKNRHYPATPKHYGTNSWFYFAINLRNETDINNPVHFAFAMYKTQDFETVYSLDENFSKDVVNVAKLTAAEIETNLTLHGSTSSPSTYVSPSAPIVINDVVYTAYYDNTNSGYKFRKIATNGAITDYDCPIVGLPTSGEQRSITMWFNGSNLIVRSSNDLYKCDLDFGNFQKADALYQSGDGLNINSATPPDNLPDIIGDYVIGGSTITEGIFPYYITRDKFFI